MISGSVGTQFSSMSCDSDVRSLWALRISVSAWNWVSVMIYGSVGTQFSSMISDCDVVDGR